MPSRPNVNAEANHPLRTATEPRGRAIALLRCGLYLCLAAAFAALAFWLLISTFHVRLNVDAVQSMAILLLVEFLLLLTTVVIPTATMIWFTREPVATFGWGSGDRLRQLGLGVVSGLTLMSVLIGLIALCGGITLKVSRDAPSTLAVHALGYALAFILVAFSEEGLLRGYALVQLSRALSFWPAAVLSSLCFALLHAIHRTEAAPGLMQAGSVGLILAYSFWRSGGLWFAWGWHASWDFAQTFIYGVPDSGVPARHALLNSQLHGPAWLTGGTVGPEGSWLVLPTLVALALLVRFALSPATQACALQPR